MAAGLCCRCKWHIPGCPRDINGNANQTDQADKNGFLKKSVKIRRIRVISVPINATGEHNV